MLRSLLPEAVACALAAQAPAPPLTCDALLGRAKPDPALLRLEADLAARERQLAATGGLLREGPTVLADPGPAALPDPAPLPAAFEAGLARLRTFGDPPDSRGFAAALQAVDLRLKEGKERPSEALFLRRQLLEAESATLQRLRDAHALATELDLLTLGDAR